MYESNYFHLPIPENMSEGMKVARCPTVRVEKRYEKGIEGWSVCQEAAEGQFLEISSDSCVEAKLKYEISGFGKGVGGRHKVGGFQHKSEVGIDEGDGIDRDVACVGGHQEFAELFGLWCRIAAEVLATLISCLKSQAGGVNDTCRFRRGTHWRGTSFNISEYRCRDQEIHVPFSFPLGNVGKEFLEHRERFGAVEG